MLHLFQALLFKCSRGKRDESVTSKGHYQDADSREIKKMMNMPDVMRDV